MFRIIKLILDVILVQNTMDPLNTVALFALETIGSSDVTPLPSNMKVTVIRCS